MNGLAAVAFVGLVLTQTAVVTAQWGMSLWTFILGVLGLTLICTSAFIALRRY